MKHSLAVAALFLFCGSVSRADTIFNIAGTIHDPGEVIQFSFTIDQVVQGSTVFDLVNGFASQTGRFHSLLTITNNINEFQIGESLIFAEFGAPVHYELIGSLNSVVLVDPPIATPEPLTLVLLGWAVLIYTLLLYKLGGEDEDEREYGSQSHPFRK